jgi:hypothetical protein
MRTLHAPLALALCSSLSFSPLAYANQPLRLHLLAGPEGMSDQQKMERAKALYGEGDTAFQSGDFPTALAKFEEAYNVYAPSLHVFNINIGLAAHAIGDCAKAKTAFQRFLDLVGDHPSRKQAQEKLLEIERSGCANQQPADPAPVTPTPGPTQSGPVTNDIEDAPVLTSRSDEREEAAEDERQKRDAAKRPMLIAGAVLAGLGGAALIGGAVSLGLANSTANDLAGLASPGPTGFPDGNYADDGVFNKDRNRLPALNRAGIGLLAGGGVLAATGVTLIVLDVIKHKKEGGGSSQRASTNRPHLTGLAPAVIPRGGGAAASMRF